MYLMTEHIESKLSEIFILTLKLCKRLSKLCYEMRLSKKHKPPGFYQGRGFFENDNLDSGAQASEGTQGGL